MAHLVNYGMLSTTTNGLAGNLVKAQCDFCGKKFGSIEEAKQCEMEHVREMIADGVSEYIQKNFVDIHDLKLGDKVPFMPTIYSGRK